MNETPRQAAERAVARGIAWLDANVRGWRGKIDVETLDLRCPCDCVLGQLDQDFYEAVWVRRLTRDEVFTFGFSAPRNVSFLVLTAAWKRALKVKGGVNVRRLREVPDLRK